VPEKYVPQVYHQLLAGGPKDLRRVDYVSYSDYFPPAKRLAVVPVPYDPGVVGALLEAEKAFWQEVLRVAETVGGLAA
jgi:hypothetical protein